MEINTRIINGHYLVSAPSTGAVSLFSPAEHLAFQEMLKFPLKDRKEVLHDLLSSHQCGEEQIANFTRIFLKKLEQQGWLRQERNDRESEKLVNIYLSVTTECNLSCTYCYIGDDRRKPDNRMNFGDAMVILGKIRLANPGARITVTGGEPFTHPDMFRILDAIEASGFRFCLGTNAVLVDEQSARRLSEYKNLLFVQASLDGMTPEVHAITRGNTFHQSLEGIKNLIKFKVPFAIAPTLHEGNLHEIMDLARFAYSNGGILAPNHLRKFPHAPHTQEIRLTQESLRKCIIETFGQVDKEFSRPVFEESLSDDRYGHSIDTRCRYICGNAGYSLDIDWNGDVYPCHLLREKQFILGNILSEEVPVILERGKNSKTRVKSYDIPKCKNCDFVATCAGGCRASAFYNQGTLAAEDEFCDILYKFEVDKLFHKKGLDFHM